MTIDYTTVLGVDAKHLEQLSHTWPTWIKYKPELLHKPLVVFYDPTQVMPYQILEVVSHLNVELIEWHNTASRYCATDQTNWKENTQRYMMLAGFVHVPAQHVKTKYWLKIDTDTIATAPGPWYDDDWFTDDPAIVAQKWGFTKPPRQMLDLDEWASKLLVSAAPNSIVSPPLNLVPKVGAGRVSHPRIISWCGFFNTEFTKEIAEYASSTIGPGLLPVQSQDGFMWYCAERLQRGVKRVNFKSRGWLHRSTMDNVKNESAKAMEG